MHLHTARSRRSRKIDTSKVLRHKLWLRIDRESYSPYCEHNSSIPMPSPVAFTENHQTPPQQGSVSFWPRNTWLRFLSSSCLSHSASFEGALLSETVFDTSRTAAGHGRSTGRFPAKVLVGSHNSQHDYDYLMWGFGTTYSRLQYGNLLIFDERSGTTPSTILLAR